MDFPSEAILLPSDDEDEEWYVDITDDMEYLDEGKQGVCVCGQIVAVYKWQNDFRCPECGMRVHDRNSLVLRKKSDAWQDKEQSTSSSGTSSEEEDTDEFQSGLGNFL